MNDIYNTIGGGNPMNWAQQRPLPTQAETMGTLLEALRAQSQTQFAHSPFGGSFNRRFGGNSFSPIQNELDAPSAKTGQELGPAEQARMITALQSAAEQGGQFVPQMTTRRTGSGTYSGPAIESSEAPMQSQPWYGEYLAAAEGGADLPMVRGSGGTPIDGQKQAAYKANRAQDMQGRRQLVQSKSQAKSDQRGVRMGNLNPMEADLRAIDRSGNGDPFNQDAMLWGPGVALGREQNAIDMQQLQASQQAGGTQFQRFVGGIVANAAANGQDLSSILPQLQAMGQSLGMQGVPMGSMSQLPPVPPNATTIAAAADKATQFQANGDPGAVLDTLGGMGDIDPQQLQQIMMQTGMTPEDLQTFLADKPMMPHGFNPGPISFIPWLLAGENEQEFNTRSRREQVANRLLQSLGQ
jgi:hypothetical protein